MKTDIRQIESGEDEIIIRYKELTPGIKRILDALSYTSTRIVGRKEENRVVIDADDIMYFESVDDKTFVYTENDVLRVDYTLQGIIATLQDERFFRCSKSMIINVDKVKLLRSMSSNRIDATLENGEHVLISRAYASDFRRLLKGGDDRG